MNERGIVSGLVGTVEGLPVGESLLCFHPIHLGGAARIHPLDLDKTAGPVVKTLVGTVEGLPVAGPVVKGVVGALP
jgi:hypothetical protein